MANNIQHIRRVNVLPETREADTMYVVKAPGATEAQLVFVGSDITQQVGIIDRISIEQLIEEAVEGVTSVYFRDTYALMLSAKPTANGLVYVLDTTGDPLGNGASAVYLYNKQTDAFQRFPNMGGGGVTPTDVTWAQILGKPVSTPAQLDKAVTDSHIHSNKLVLDRLTEDAQQKLTFRGLPVAEPATVKFLGSGW